MTEIDTDPYRDHICARSERKLCLMCECYALSYPPLRTSRMCQAGGNDNRRVLRDQIRSVAGQDAVVDACGYKAKHMHRVRFPRALGGVLPRL